MDKTTVTSVKAYLDAVADVIDAMEVHITQLTQERDNARVTAWVLAQAYKQGVPPPAAIVDEALGFPRTPSRPKTTPPALPKKG